MENMRYQFSIFFRDLQSGLNVGKSSNSRWTFEPETPNLWRKKRNPTAQVLPVRTANQMITMESLRSPIHPIPAKKLNPIPLMLFSPNPMERNISIHQNLHQCHDFIIKTCSIHTKLIFSYF